jgi:transcriptional regulator with XRE-family HTH domain
MPVELKWEHLVETMRVLRGWGQKELAAAVGMDTATISKYEQGISEPSGESRRRIEEVLGISGDVATSLAELAGGIERGSPSRRGWDLRARQPREFEANSGGDLVGT